MSVPASVVSHFCVGTDSWFVLPLFLLLEEASTSTSPIGMDEVEVAQCFLHTEKSFSSPVSDWEVGKLPGMTFVFFGRSSTPVVPNLFGTRDGSSRRQFLHRLGRVDGFRTIQTHYIYCTLNF